MSRWYSIALISVSLATAQGSTYSSTQGSILTLKSALDFAQKQSTDLSLAHSQKDLAQVDLDKQKSVWLPTLTAGTDLEDDKTFNRNQANELTWAANLTLTEKLDRTTSANIKSQQLTLRASDHDLRATEETTVATTLSNYLNALRDSMLVTVQVQNVTLQEQKLVQLQAFEKLGTKAHSDVLQQSATLAQAKVQLLNARTQFSNSLADLFAGLGVEQPSSQVLLQALPAKTLQRLSTQDSTALQNKGAGDPSIAAQQARIEAAQASLEATQLSYWPSLQFMAQLNHNDLLAQTPANALYTTPMLTEGLRVQAAVTFNILDQDSRNSQTLSNQIQIQTAQTKLKALQTSSATLHTKALRAFTASQHKLAATKDSKESADLVLADMQARFALGVTAIIDLHTVELQQQQAASDEIQAEFDLWNAYIDLCKTEHRLTDFTSELD